MTQVCDTCLHADLASQHDQQECVWRNLVGVNCFISSPTEGYMYKVAGKPKLLTTLTYSSPAIQVNIGLMSTDLQ